MKAGRPKGVKSKVRPLRHDMPVMTVTEACDYLRIGRTTLYRMIRRGEIPYFKIGADYRFNHEESRLGCEGRSSPKVKPQRLSEAESENSLIVPLVGTKISLGFGVCPIPKRLEA
jgi:excisionase family DNA binding protein